MNTKEILYESIIEIKKLLSKKEISALELTKLSLERIEETNNKTNAFLYVAENEALEDAKKIDFDDSFIYSEIPKKIGDRKIKMTQMLRDDALKAFEIWDKKVDKIKY